MPNGALGLNVKTQEMANNPTKVPGRSWILVTNLIFACWATTFLGPVSLLIIPVLIFGLIVSIRGRAWIGLCALLIFNPLAVYFIGGVVSYINGAPSIQFYGLPGIESFNLDRSSRCFRSGGGCLISGNEWVYLSPHNSAIRLMVRMFGPPSKSYDGPYPTKEEATTLTGKSLETPLPDFFEGGIKVDGRTIILGKDLVNRLVDGLHLSSFRFPEASEYGAKVRAVVYQERCVIVRLSEGDTSSEKVDEMDSDILIFFDMKTKRPFAYFTINGNGAPRFPPVRYLPEHNR